MLSESASLFLKSKQYSSGRAGRGRGFGDPILPPGPSRSLQRNFSRLARCSRAVLCPADPRGSRWGRANLCVAWQQRLRQPRPPQGSRGFAQQLGAFPSCTFYPVPMGFHFYFLLIFFSETCLLAALELLTSPAFPVLPDKTVDFWGGRSCFKRQANAYRETDEPLRYAPHQFAVGQKPRVCVYICIYIYIYLKTAVVKFWLTVKRQHTNI